jgi:hypothetical protein
MRTKRAAIGGLVLLGCAVGAGWLRSASTPSYIVVEGHVYAALDPVRGPVAPIVGAAVSNNWDATSTMTDSAGRFVIRVKRVAPDEFVVLHVEAREKAACQRLAGGIPSGRAVNLFLDGGRFGSQRCPESRGRL